MSEAFQLTMLRIAQLAKHSPIMDFAKPSIDLVFCFAKACNIGFSFAMSKESALEKQPLALAGNPVLVAQSRLSVKRHCRPIWAAFSLLICARSRP